MLFEGHVVFLHFRLKDPCCARGGGNQEAASQGCGHEQSGRTDISPRGLSPTDPVLRTEQPLLLPCHERLVNEVFHVI